MFLGGLRRCGDLADAVVGGLSQLFSRCCAGNRFAENNFGFNEFKGQETQKVGQKQRRSLKTDAAFWFVSRLAIFEEARRCRTSSRFGGPKKRRMKAEDAFSVGAGSFWKNDDPLFGFEKSGDFPSDPRKVGSMGAAQVERARPTAKCSYNRPVSNFAFADKNARRGGGDHDDVEIAEVVGRNKPPFGNLSCSANAEAEDLRESLSVRLHPFLAIFGVQPPSFPQADAMKEKPRRPD